MASPCTTQSPSIAQAEQSDVGSLKPLTPRRAFLWGGFINPGIFIIDADKGEMEGYLPKSDWSNFAIAPGGKAYYVRIVSAGAGRSKAAGSAAYSHGPAPWQARWQ